MAQRMLIEYMNKILDLDIKPDWKMTKAMYEDRNGKARGSLLDYMGFRFHGGNTVSKGYLGKQVKYRKTWVTIRKRIFLAARRKRKIFSDKLRKKIQVKMKFVQSVVSQFGWFKSTNMAHYRKKNSRKQGDDSDRDQQFQQSERRFLLHRVFSSMFFHILMVGPSSSLSPGERILVVVLTA